jgi:hypothetical protein
VGDPLAAQQFDRSGLVPRATEEHGRVPEVQEVVSHFRGFHDPFPSVEISGHRVSFPKEGGETHLRRNNSIVVDWFQGQLINWGARSCV